MERCSCLYQSHHQWDIQVILSFQLFFKSTSEIHFQRKKTTTKKWFLCRNLNGVKHSQSLYKQLVQKPTAAQDMVNRCILYTTTGGSNTYKLQLQPIPASTTENGLQILCIGLSHQGIPTLKSAGVRSGHQEAPQSFSWRLGLDRLSLLNTIHSS